ncbi:hypothetical protein K435DRAFT_867063 [Dendrothele bispora CBS 962.96]|uniref:Septin-type G domain-containing protein n=1 Tax=Dendrothele bispora (strain CBS 962.96) TaxID=1314807 RepID=A0A4V4HDL6_DENBC|nr:hypothetical protein K435DRAFT_867063 [Dendrothele bispora CBS 962.96]
MSTNFQPSDIVILVTGAVGAGRSTFINDFLGPGAPGRMKVGDSCSLDTCTTRIDYEIVNSSTRRNLKNRLVIVDTPGFDDHSKSDFEVLQEIASWIQESDRYRSMDNTNVVVLNKWFGRTEDIYRRIVLVTTKWSRIVYWQEAIKRQTRLESSHWNQLITRGSKLDSFRENSLDAERIVDEFCRALESEAGFTFGDGLKDVQNSHRSLEEEDCLHG